MGTIKWWPFFTCGQWCVRFIFVESESSQSHKPFESEWSQGHLKFFRVQSKSESWLGRVRVESQELSSHKNYRVTSTHWFASSSQCRVTRNFTFFLRHFLLWNTTQHAIKWHSISQKMMPNVVLTSLNAGYLYLCFSVCILLVSFTLNHFKNLAQPCC